MVRSRHKQKMQAQTSREFGQRLGQQVGLPLSQLLYKATGDKQIIKPNLQRLLQAIALGVSIRELLRVLGRDEDRRLRPATGRPQTAIEGDSPMPNSAACAGSRTRPPALLELLFGSRGSDCGYAELTAVAVIWTVNCAMILRKASLLGSLFTAQSDRSIRRRWLGHAIEHLILSALSSLLSESIGQFQSQIALRWRKNIIKKINGMYFAQQAFFRIQTEGTEAPIQDADSRICHDVREIANSTAEVAVSLIKACIKTTIFAAAASFYHHWAWSLAPPMFFFIAVRAVLKTEPADGSYIHTSLQFVESRLRQYWSRLQNNLKNVSMLQGEAFELEILQKSVRDVSAVSRKRYDIMFLMDMSEWMSFHSSQTSSFIELMAVFAAASMAYQGSSTEASQGFRRQSPGKWAALQAGLMFRDVHIFLNACSGWGLFLRARTLLIGCAPATSRIKQLVSRLEPYQVQPSKSKRVTKRHTTENSTNHVGFVDNGPMITFQGVTIHSPSKQVPFRELTFRVSEGEPLLVTGQLGAGKTTIVRSLFALWPISVGHIGRPGGNSRVEEGVPLPEDILYVPERPLLDGLPLLSDQITHPVAVPGGLPWMELQLWLQYVGLEHIPEGLATAADVDWAQLLPLCDQQALAFARLFYNRPRFALIDETTSALTAAQELTLLQAALELGITCITFARLAGNLEEQHFQHLELHGARGEDTLGWKLMPTRTGRQPLMGRQRCRGIDEAHERLAALLLQTGEGDCDVLPTETDEMHKSSKSSPSSLQNRTSASPSVSTSSRAAVKATSCTTEEVLQRWPKRVQRLLAVLQIGLQTASRRQDFLQRVGLVLLFLYSRTRLHWQFCRGLAGLVKASLRRDMSLAAAELITSTGVVLAGGLSDQLLRYKMGHIAIDYWSSVLSHLQRKLLRDTNVLHVSFEVEDPITRLAEARTLVESIWSQVSDALIPLANLVFILPVLVRSFGPIPLAISACHWALLVLSQRVFGCGEASASSSQSSMLENRFQALHSRLRAHAESVTLCAGGPAQLQELEACFEDILAQGLRPSTHDLFGRAGRTFVQDFQNLPIWILRILSLVFLRRLKVSLSIEALCSTILFDRVVQLVQVSLQHLWHTVEKASLVDGQLTRCLEIAVAAERAQRTIGQVDNPTSTSVSLEIEGVDVIAEDGSQLAKCVSFKVLSGEPLLICGPSCSGKSLLARHICGLRMHKGFSETRHQPSRDLLMVATQRPFLPVGCRLYAQLAYPAALRFPSRGPFVIRLANLPSQLSEGVLGEHVSSLGASGLRLHEVGGARCALATFRSLEELLRALARPQDRSIGGVELDCELGFTEAESFAATDLSGPPQMGELVPRFGRMRKCLRAVGLEHILTREQEGWLARRSWEELLTLEEKQRLCVARLLYHRPRFCLLDDATCALPTFAAGAMHSVLQEWGITPVAVTRRPCFPEIYRSELQLGLSLKESSAGWKLSQRPESNRALEAT